MCKKFEINRTKIRGSCQSGREVVPHDSKSDLPLTLGKAYRKGFNGLEKPKKKVDRAGAF